MNEYQITIDNSFIAWGRDKSRRKPEPPSLWLRMRLRLSERDGRHSHASENNYHTHINHFSQTHCLLAKHRKLDGIIHHLAM